MAERPKARAPRTVSPGSIVFMGPDGRAGQDEFLAAAKPVEPLEPVLAPDTWDPSPSPGARDPKTLPPGPEPKISAQPRRPAARPMKPAQALGGPSPNKAKESQSFAATPLKRLSKGNGKDGPPDTPQIGDTFLVSSPTPESPLEETLVAGAISQSQGIKNEPLLKSQPSKDPSNSGPGGPEAPLGSSASQAGPADQGDTSGLKTVAPDQPDLAPLPSSALDEPSKKRWAHLLGSLALAILIIAGALYLLHYRPARISKDREASYASLMAQAAPFIRGEEHGPPAPAQLISALARPFDGDPAKLAEGLRLFLASDFDGSRREFQELAASRPGDSRLMSLLASANLRQSNYGLAKDLYSKALAGPYTNDRDSQLLLASDKLGYALAAFQLLDMEEAYPKAEEAWQARAKLLGPESPETMSALTVTGAVLIGLRRYNEAEKILSESIRLALDQGRGREDQVMVDALNVLALSYSLRDGYNDLERPPEARSQPNPEVPIEALAPVRAEENKDTEVLSEPANPYENIDYQGASRALSELSSTYPQSQVRYQLLEALIRYHAPEGELCQAPASGPPGREGLLSLCLNMARALLSKGSLEEGLNLTDRLLSWPELMGRPEGLALMESGAAAAQVSGREDLAEEILRQALGEAAKTKPFTQRELNFVLKNSYRLAQSLLAQERPPLEAEMELVGTKTRVSKLLPAKALDDYPEAAVFEWGLARLLRQIGRDRDSRASYDKAGAILDRALKSQPQRKEELESLKASIKADRSWSSRSQSPQPAYPGDEILPSSPAEADDGPASPEAMRLELSGLKSLGRIGEFGPKIEVALALSASRDGRGSPAWLRYQSLRLKFLEESQNHARLIKELREMADSPPPGNSGSQALFRSAAKRYEARVLEGVGDIPGAMQALLEALDALAGQSGQAESAQRINKEYQRLKDKVAQP